MIDINSLQEMSTSGVLKLEISAGDFLQVINDIAHKTAQELLTKFEKERSPEFISRKEAMKLLGVATNLTMNRWENKEYLIPYKISGRVYYKKDEVLGALERCGRKNLA